MENNNNKTHGDKSKNHEQVVSSQSQKLSDKHEDMHVDGHNNDAHINLEQDNIDASDDEFKLANFDKLVEIVKNLEEKLSTVSQEKDVAIKALADEKNFVTSFKQRASDEAKKELKNLSIAIIDAIEPLFMAVSLMSEEEKKKSKPYHDLCMGVQMTLSNIERELVGFGIKRFGEAGEVFDHAKHEVLAMENSDLPQGSIVRVIKSGIAMHDKIIRCAAVSVSGKKRLVD